MAAYKGSRHHFSKLEEGDVELILELDQERRRVKAKLDTLSHQAIANKFGISKQRVWEICNAWDGAWSHV